MEEQQNYRNLDQQDKNNKVAPTSPNNRKYEENNQEAKTVIAKKDQEFIDHTLLAPEYLRDSHNFIIDLIEDQSTVFSKNVSIPNASVHNLNSDFSNSIFNFVNKSNVEVIPPLRSFTQPDSNVTVPNDRQTDSFISKDNPDYLLNGNYLNTATGPTVIENNDNCVENPETQYPPLSLLSDHHHVTLENNFLNSDDFICQPSNLRKLLPHKKRISRKLKVEEITDNSPNSEKLEERFPTELLPAIHLQYKCEICSYLASSQLDFFAHLKQHYEPPANLLSSKKFLSKPQKCLSDTYKTKPERRHSRLFENMPLNFEEFDNVAASEQNNIQINQNVDLKIGNHDIMENNIKNNVPQNNAAPVKALYTDEVEFSDPEDMLEEDFRNVVAKVSIEDTCDDINLIDSATTRPPWFADNFSGIDFKNKSFSDVSFSGQLAQLLDVENVSIVDTSPTDNPKTFKISEPYCLAEFTIESEEKLENGFEMKTDVLFEADNVAIDTILANESDNVHLAEKFEKNSTKELENCSNANFECTSDEDEFMNDNNESVKNLKHDRCSKDRINSKVATKKNKLYICIKCKREFNSSNALKYHNRVHENLRPHQCDYCGRSFFAASALKSHVYTHTGQKPFDCDKCERKFRQWGDLKFHIISKHTDEKNHQCEFCGKAFSRKYSLVIHRRIHTSERNYKCEFCNKTFRASQYLQNHRKIHTGEKPYECDTCSKKFRVCGDMKRHKKIHQRSNK